MRRLLRAAGVALALLLATAGHANARPVRLTFTQARAEADLRSSDVLRTSDTDKVVWCNRWSATRIDCGVEAISTHDHYDPDLGPYTTQTTCTQTVSVRRGVKRGVYSRLADDRSCIYDA